MELAEATTAGHGEGRLALLAIAGQGLVYGLAMALARDLGVDGFDDYAVAGAVFMLTAAIAPLGSDKFALRLLPVLIERKDWGRVHGYLRFGLRRSLGMSLMLAVVVIISALALGDRLPGGTRRAVVFAALGIPLGALVQFGLEALTALGREFIASVIARIVVPATALVFAALVMASEVEASGATAVACWGPAWLLALLLMAAVARRSLPAQVRLAHSTDEASHWRSETRPFFVYRLALALLGQSGLIALALLQTPAAAIGAYAVAAGTTGLAAVMASATNRAYSRRLSLLLERMDYAGVQRLRRERLRWLLPSVGLFLAISTLFGGPLLALFRPEFAEQGAVALRILAVGVSVAVLLALAPTCLKYQRRKQATYMTLTSAAAMQVLLLLMLVPRFGATGAAAASALSMCGMYGAFALMALRELQRFRAACNKAAGSQGDML